MTRVLFIKVAVDVCMTVLLILAMSNRITGNIAHEVIGISMFLLFAVHNILNRRWYKTLLKGRYTPFRVMKIILNLLLVIVMSVLLMSSVYISQTVFDFIQADGSLFIRKIHVCSAYWGFILMSIHVGFHWEFIRGLIRKKAAVISTHMILLILLRSVALLIVVLGCKAFVDIGIAAKLIMHYAFDVWDMNESAIGMICNYLFIMGMFVFVTYYTLKFFRKRKSHENITTEKS